MNTRNRSKKKTPNNNKQECKCTKHDEVCPRKNPQRLHKVTGKDFNKKHLRYLIEKNLLGKFANYVCNECLNYAARKLAGHDTQIDKDPEEENDFTGDVTEEDGGAAEEMMEENDITGDVTEEDGGAAEEMMEQDDNHERG